MNDIGLISLAKAIHWSYVSSRYQESIILSYDPVGEDIYWVVLVHLELFVGDIFLESCDWWKKKTLESQRMFVSKVYQKKEIMKEKENWVERTFYSVGLSNKHWWRQQDSLRLKKKKGVGEWLVDLKVWKILVQWSKFSCCSRFSRFR